MRSSHPPDKPVLNCIYESLPFVLLPVKEIQSKSRVISPSELAFEKNNLFHHLQENSILTLRVSSRVVHLHKDSKDPLGLKQLTDERIVFASRSSVSAIQFGLFSLKHSNNLQKVIFKLVICRTCTLGLLSRQVGIMRFSCIPLHFCWMTLNNTDKAGRTAYVSRSAYTGFNPLTDYMIVWYSCYHLSANIGRAFVAPRVGIINKVDHKNKYPAIRKSDKRRQRLKKCFCSNMKKDFRSIYRINFQWTGNLIGVHQRNYVSS